MVKYIGEYAPGYNREVHGPYDPARYYGKPDTPFGEVKLGDLPAWILRRSFNPIDWARACSRAWWRWNHKWTFPRKAGMAGIYQLIFMISLASYVSRYDRHYMERNAKYH